MSKKDKKRIVKLEKSLSNLIRMHVNLRDNYILHSIEQDKLKAFPAGTIPSEKEQEKTEQPQQTEAQKERELMEQLNKELAKFSSLEAFNADRKNFFLPPIDKLEFDKKKAAFEYALAAAKVLRPQWYDQIDQIKIPKEEQGETEQPKPESHRENLGEPILNKPKQFNKGLLNPEQLDASLSKLAELPLKSEQELAEEKRANNINAALKMAVEDLYKHLNFTLQNFSKDRAKQVEMLQAYCDHFKQDLADFRRKVLSVSELGGVKENEAILPAPEEKEADENTANLGKPDGSELSKSDSKDLGGADGADSPTRAGYSYIVIVNYKRGGVPLYLLDFERISCDGVPDMSIETTYTKQRAYKFEHIKQAQNIIDLATGFDCFKEYNFFIDTLQ